MYKLIITTLLIMNVLSATSVLMQDDNSHQNYRVIYNALPNVEEADNHLKKQENFAEFLEEISKIITRFNLQNSVGLRLIHRHFGIQNKQLMSEHFECIDNIPSLVTSPLNLTEATLQAACSASWMFSKNDQILIPFEFSNDKAVNIIRERIRNLPGFIEAIRDVIMEYDYSSLMSLAILERETMSSINGIDYAFMEKTSRSKGSIVQPIHNQDLVLSKSIQTAWSFSPRTTNINCIPSFYCDKNDPDELHANVPFHDQE